jgi:DNA-binding response OmpR family regulator
LSGKDDANTRPEVLVIDDQAAVGIMLELALRHFGFTVHLAGAGQQALEAFRRHADTIDVVLLDVQMPYLDGPGTLAALRRVHLSVPVVFMSGNTGRYSEQDLLTLGAARVLQKPFNLDELSRLLWQLARGHSRPSP